MTDPDLIAFLRWALPRLGLHWPGFRKVRGRVRKRLNARPREPGLPDVAAYQDHLEAYPGEWAILDGLCRITVTRFHRDRGLFDRLRRVVLPEPAQRAWDRGTEAVRCWSAGCASGEESYTLKILRELGLPERPDGGPTCPVTGCSGGRVGREAEASAVDTRASHRTSPRGPVGHRKSGGDRVTLSRYDEEGELLLSVRSSP